MTISRTIRLKLNKFPTVPPAVGLRAPHGDFELNIDLAKLYHHYYLDSHGRKPPKPDPVNFEYLPFFSDCDDFRFTEGIGTNPGATRLVSTKLGQALARWFMHDYLGFTYFAHMHAVLDKPADPRLLGYAVHRIQPGDSPDYLCSDGSCVVAAEAKGRHSSIGFQTSEFAGWRQQFSRIEVRDPGGIPRSIKGVIAASRFVTEKNRPATKAQMFVEDPATSGDGDLSPEGHEILREYVLRHHYSRVAELLDQPVLASALTTGVAVPEVLVFPSLVWEFVMRPLEGMRFFGGFYPTPGAQTKPWFSGLSLQDGVDLGQWGDLSRPHLSFVGVEYSVGKAIASLARARPERVDGLSFMPEGLTLPSQVSLLRDGSILSPVDFLVPVGAENM